MTPSEAEVDYPFLVYVGLHHCGLFRSSLPKIIIVPGFGHTAFCPMI